MGRCFEHEARVVGEPFYVAFISCVHEDGSLVLGSTPMDIGDEISLLEGLVAIGIVIEVVKNLSEELGLVKGMFGRARLKVRPSSCSRESGYEMSGSDDQTQQRQQRKP